MTASGYHGIVRKIIDRHRMERHPEGGYYREFYQANATVMHPAVEAPHDAVRPASTGMYFLLAGDDYSAFHRVVTSDETWHLYGGGPLELHVIDGTGRYDCHILTGDLTAGDPTAVVRAGCWQAARLAPGAEWMLAGCTVAPGFDFADWEMGAKTDLIEIFPQHASIIRDLARDDRDDPLAHRDGNHP